ncbi:uncharacterized protein LOC112591846 [Melanaphis sacchari]|uniref:uncharacterized protein LOC112591846 n=1 Tax=Melanaphis sacchari TaxID=742174 RepID=UPI000DC13593|nr:uncharacterized protein LOC112591846 [Melanaphis sacchari]
MDLINFLKNEIQKTRKEIADGEEREIQTEIEKNNEIYVQKILTEESEFIAKGSGWSLVSIDGLQLRINLVNPLKGSSYIDLPLFIKEKKAIVNVKNKDNYCFKYSILSKYDKRLNKSRFNQVYFNFLEKKSGLNFKCIDFPTPIKQIKIFERLNNVSVNVYSLNNKTAEQRKTHESCTTCNLCKTKFSQDDHKVADHCHLSGKCRQSLCNTCNLKLQTANFVPIFFHNLSHYAAHFIVTRLDYDTNSISVMPKSEEKFISFSKYIIEKFRDNAKHFSTQDLPLVTRKD